MEKLEPVASPRRKPRWYLYFTIILAAALLVLALRGVSWKEMVVTIRSIRTEYLLIMFSITSISIFTRGVRWGILLSAERKIPLLTMFWATSAGYLGNNFLPARAGEVIRSVALGRKANISMSYVLATALTERIMDVLILVLISLLTLPTLGEIPGWLPGATRLMAVLGVGAVAVLIFAPFLAPILHKIVGWLPVKQGLKERLNGLLEQFLRGTQAFLHPARAGGFLLLSVVIWLLDGANAMIAAHSFNLSLSLPQAMLYLAGLGLGSAVPSTPGYLGIYQFVATTILPAFGFTRSQALTYVLTAQAIGVLAITVWGLIGLWRLGGRKMVNSQDIHQM
ncbi:MAG TPA: lysylphosphatidylglycerol synthase transmembrane domain-containing protein [Anaerolineaceae bacterium]